LKERAVPAPRQPSSFVALLAGAAFALVLAGCAVQTPRLLAEPPADLPRRVELAETPFFPQEEFQCGPAALATALSAAGLPTRPDDVADQASCPREKGRCSSILPARGDAAQSRRGFPARSRR